MACFICPISGSRMCGVKNCQDCGECDLADTGHPSERDYGEGYDKGCSEKAAQNGNMEAGS